MKIPPYMGTSHIVVSYLFEKLGFEVIYPPTPSKERFLGVQMHLNLLVCPLK